jgi:hypothetical protein
VRPSARVIANRLNAKCSTGPRTQQGRARTSQNALRHGLAVPVSLLPGATDHIAQMARLIARDELFQVAREIAEAQIDLMRIRRMKHELLSDPKAREKPVSRKTVSANARETKRITNLVEQLERKNQLTPEFEEEMIHQVLTLTGEPLEPQPQSLEAGMDVLADRLASFYRYERRALSRRKKAIRALTTLYACRLEDKKNSRGDAASPLQPATNSQSSSSEEAL